MYWQNSLAMCNNFLIFFISKNPKTLYLTGIPSFFRILLFLRTHKREQLSPAVAGECLRCFKKTIGISPMQYLLKHRITVAARLLVESHLNITEIGDLSGFENPSHFARTFKHVMSCTPSEYRKKRL